MDSMEEIYMKHGKMIYGFLLTRTRDPGLAEELTQETFFQVYLSLPKYKGDSGILTWICGIAKNVCRRYYKKNPVTVEFSGIESELLKGGGFPGMEEKAEQRELYTHAVQEIMEMKIQGGTDLPPVF